MVTRNRRKRFFFFFVLMATVVLVSELASATAIGVANRWLGEDIRSRRSLMSSHDRSIERFLATEGAREVLDSLLGFRYRSGFVGEGDTINSRGLRGSREYPPRSQDDRIRVAAAQGAILVDVAAKNAVLQADGANYADCNHLSTQGNDIVAGLFADAVTASGL